MFYFCLLQTVIRYNNNKIQLGISVSRHRDNQGPVRLQPSHIVGALIIWGIGIGFSVIAFIFEILLTRKLK